MEESCFATFGRMSRIGKNPIIVPEGVKIEQDNSSLLINGPKGQLSVDLFEEIDLRVDKDSIGVSIKNNDRHSRAMHGTVRQLISNAIEGVNNGFSKRLEILGVGYSVKSQGNRLVFQLGFSHDIVLELPDGIEADAQKNKLEIKGIDKQLVGQVSAKIRSLRKPEPYKGKGIRYKDEYVRRKQGKTVGGTE